MVRMFGLKNLGYSLNTKMLMMAFFGLILMILCRILGKSVYASITRITSTPPYLLHSLRLKSTQFITQRLPMPVPINNKQNVRVHNPLPTRPPFFLRLKILIFPSPHNNLTDR